MLVQNEEDLLNHHFDSLEVSTGWRFVYSSVNNFEKGSFDSLASNEFIQFPLAEAGALIFLGRGDATVEILVGNGFRDRGKVNDLSN